MSRARRALLRLPTSSQPVRRSARPRGLAGWRRPRLRRKGSAAAVSAAIRCHEVRRERWDAHDARCGGQHDHGRFGLGDDLRAAGGSMSTPATCRSGGSASSDVGIPLHGRWSMLARSSHIKPASSTICSLSACLHESQHDSRCAASHLIVIRIRRQPDDALLKLEARSGRIAQTHGDEHAVLRSQCF